MLVCVPFVGELIAFLIAKPNYPAKSVLGALTAAPISLCAAVELIWQFDVGLIVPLTGAPFAGALGFMSGQTVAHRLRLAGWKGDEARCAKQPVSSTP
jgi:hypothetical protein